MNTEIIVALIGAAVTIANVLFTTITSRKRRADERMEQLEAGVQCLLRLEIIRSHEKYIERGSCPIYAREALTRGRTRHTTPSAATTSRPSSIAT